MNQKLLVLNIVGLTPDLISYMLKFQQWIQAKQAVTATLNPPLPAVTCSSQSTMITGKNPNEHGIVGNGWYFKDLAEIGFWKQSNHLVQSPKVWDVLKAKYPDFKVAQMFWWYNMYATTDYSVTPRPVYPADGRKIPSIYTDPPELKDELQGTLGQFPLFHFWGPTASIISSNWIAKATLDVIEKKKPELAFCYLPHLDYDLQRYGIEDQAVLKKCCGEIDEVATNLLEKVGQLGYECLIVSEYGIENVEHPIDLNRILRKQDDLQVQLVDTHWELIDAGRSRAFAVCDHQIAHVYIKNPQDIARLKDQLQKLEGVEKVLDRNDQKAYGIDHDRSGDLLLVASPKYWFTYYYWLDEKRRPDFATSVDIHRKPGYDPIELYVDPKILFPKLRVAHRLIKKILGFRYYMDLISTDGALLKGSHGRAPSRKELGPVCVSTLALFEQGSHLPMSDVYHLILKAFDAS